MKKCRWSKHVQTEKHKQNETAKHDEEEKVNKMTDEEKDEYFKMKKLKQIWKTVWLRGYLHIFRNIALRKIYVCLTGRVLMY